MTKTFLSIQAFFSALAGHSQSNLLADDEPYSTLVLQAVQRHSQCTRKKWSGAFPDQIPYERQKPNKDRLRRGRTI